MSLRQKTVNGFAWSFIDNIANSGISFLVGVILARMLSPKEFGIIGMITLFIAISNTIIDSGFGTALIRKQKVKDEDYNTVFIFNLLTSILLYLALFLSASWISSFFNEPQLISITRVIGTILIINAISLVPRTKLIKNIDFKTQAKISLISSVTSGLIGITLAYYKMGVWSLVGVQLFRQIFQSIFLFIYCKWIPNMIFSLQSFKELFGFSIRVLLADLINTFYKNIYYVVIGKIYSAVQLGYYTRSEQFNTIFTNNLTNIIYRVSYPALSSIQDDQDKFYDSFRKLLKCSALLSFTGVLGLAAVSKSLVIVLIGDSWLESAEYLQIISLYGILYPLQTLNLSILNVKGRSDLLLKLEFLKKIFFIPVILIGVTTNLKTMLWASVLYYYFEYLCNSFYSKRLIGYGTIDQLKDLFPLFILSSIIALLTISLNLLNILPITTLIIQISVFVLLFLITHELYHLEEYTWMKNYFKYIIFQKK